MAILSDVFAKHAKSLSDLQTPTDDTSIDGVPVIAFEWNGATYSCLYSITFGGYQDQGGMVPMDILVLSVLQTMPIPGPRIHDDIVFPSDASVGFPGLDIDQRTWRIEAITLVQGSQPKITCYDQARGS